MTGFLLASMLALVNPLTRQELWNYLAAIYSAHQLPWLVLGNFNEIIAFADKNGGPYIGKFGGLKRWVQNDAMIDLGY